MNRDQVIVRTSFVGIISNIGLVAVKAIIGFLVGSIAIILDALNNLTDAISSIITIIGTKLSNKAPDKKHPYGFGRIEYLTSMIIAVIVLLAGFTAVRESISSIVSYFKEGSIPKYTTVSLVIVSIAVVAKVALGLYFRHQGKKVHSDALKASGTDALMDSILSFSTLVAGILCITTGVSIEGYLGILIGLLIIKSGCSILLDSIDEIIGKRSSKELVEAIQKTVNSFPQVKGCYDLVLDNYGPSKIIGSIHIEVKDDLQAKEIHALTRQIQYACKVEHNVLMTVGIYASNESDASVTAIKKNLYDIVKKHKEVLQIHGFYVEEDKNVITFDLVIDFKTKLPPPEIKKEIIAEISSLYPEYVFLANIDDDYTL